jgi:hypothetical protein
MLTISDGGIASDARVPTCPKHPLHGPIVRKLAKPEGVPHECVAAGEVVSAFLCAGRFLALLSSTKESCSSCLETTLDFSHVF